MRVLLILPFLLAGCFFPVGGCYYPDQASWSDAALYSAVTDVEGANVTVHAPTGLPFDHAPDAALQAVSWVSGAWPDEMRFTLTAGHVQVDGWAPEANTSIEEPFRRFARWLLEPNGTVLDGWVDALAANRTDRESAGGRLSHGFGDEPARYHVTAEVDVHGPYSVGAFWEELEAVGVAPTPEVQARAHDGPTGFAARAGPWTFDFEVPWKNVATAQYSLTVGVHGAASFSGDFDVGSDEEYLEAMNVVLEDWGLPAAARDDVEVSGAIC